MVGGLEGGGRRVVDSRRLNGACKIVRLSGDCLALRTCSCHELAGPLCGSISWLWSSVPYLQKREAKSKRAGPFLDMYLAAGHCFRFIPDPAGLLISVAFSAPSS